MPASSSASWAASRTRPAIETSLRAVRCAVCPMPTTATGFPAITWLLRCAIPGSAASAPSAVPFEHDDHVLLQARTARRVGDPALRFAVGDAPGDLADADQTRAHHRVRLECAARRVDRRVAVELQRLGEDQLLVAELRVQLGNVDVAV